MLTHINTFDIMGSLQFMESYAVGKKKPLEKNL